MNDGQAYDDRGLPWLEAVDNDDAAPAVSGRKMFAALVMVLVAVALVAGAFFWIGRGVPAVTGAPELIKAEPGPYKVKPDKPGGLDIAGDSETAFATGAGEDTDAALDPAKLPPAATTPPAEEPKTEAQPAPVEATPALDAAPAAAGPTIQLGAYGSSVKAETAWGMLSGRFPEVAAMGKQVVSAQVGGKTVVRLRATGSAAQASAACSALRAAGESCLAIK